MSGTETAQSIAEELERFIDEAVKARGGATTPVKPTHRVPFTWPPHAVSADYHVMAHDWHGKAQFEAHGEVFEVQVARTPLGVFGRSEKLWHEARGESLEEMLDVLRDAAEPLFKRQFAIAEVLGLPGRFEGRLQDLRPAELVKLLYCPDRDVSNEARIMMETEASLGIFSLALIAILRDQRHPHRRSAQWCVLDMFEDLPSFCPTPELQQQAVDAIKELMWSAEDDYARTIYKAGVVLGGHICTEAAADALIECVNAPSIIGRRSAIHAALHLAEWMPSRKGQVLTKLRNRASIETEPLLKEFTAAMVRDVEQGAVEHMTEPVFPGEA